MCFSETSSFINFILLSGYGTYLFKTWRVALPLWYLGLKDLLQALLYRYMDTPHIENILGMLSYVHICFQPFIFNMIFSYFDTASNKKSYWNIIFVITFLWGLWCLTYHHRFDIQNDPDCNDKKSDYCSSEDGGYNGKYHLGYKFKTEKPDRPMYPVLLFLPSLFTRVYPLSLSIAAIALTLEQMTILLGVRNGEFAAIWCFLSIIYLIPIAFFRKSILKWLQ